MPILRIWVENVKITDFGNHIITEIGNLRITARQWTKKGAARQMSETETIARNLSGELARHRKTQAALAKELGMSEKTVSERLGGKGSFNTEQLEKTATMLGMSLYQLMIKLLQPIDSIKQIKP